MRTMSQIPQVKIPATYLRGGTSKGVFFSLQDLPESARAAGPARDALLLRVIGSPDPYGKQTDGMGGDEAQRRQQGRHCSGGPCCRPHQRIGGRCGRGLGASGRARHRGG